MHCMHIHKYTCVYIPIHTLYLRIRKYIHTFTLPTPFSRHVPAYSCSAMLEVLSVLLGRAAPVQQALRVLAPSAAGWHCVPPSGWTAPWEREYKHVVLTPPPFVQSTATVGLKPGPSRDRLFARRQSEAPGAGFPRRMRYPERISSRISEIKERYPARYPQG